MEIRPLAPDEFVRISELDVTEAGSSVYVWREGHLLERAEEWRRPPLTSARVQEITREWPAIVEQEGVVLGSFDGSNLVGVAVLKPHLSETMAQLFYLHVSQAYRRQGVARDMVNEIICYARESGAHTLYVSATPSPSAVGFYRSLGFAPVAVPHPDLLALEPEDIHMSLPLREE